MEELEKDLNDEQVEMGELLDQAPTIDVGEVILAKVVNVSDEYVFVDVGLKSEGQIPLQEFSHLAKDKYPQAGNSIPVIVRSAEGKNGQPNISYRQAYVKSMREKINRAFAENTPIEGTITKKIKGGWAMDLGEEAFLPQSQTGFSGKGSNENLIGKKFAVKILEWSSEKNNLVVSCRKLLEEESAVVREQTLKELQEGQIRKGIVKTLTAFGAFVNLGGIDGLVHINDLSWKHIKHPKEAVNVGQEIEVKILKLDLTGEKISLGLKQLTENPWENIAAKYLPNNKVKGKVVSFTAFGAFVEIEPGIEGLVHISELSWKEKIQQPEKILKIGQETVFVILSIDREKEKISLSLKRAEVNPWEETAKNHPVGSKIKGKITRLVPFGAFVALNDLEIEGLIHVSDISWMRKIQHPGNVLKEGQETEAMVLEISPKEEKIRLGIKQLSPNPFRKYREGSIVEGKVIRLTDFGAFIQLEEEIEGLVHVSEIAKERITHPSEALKIDEVIKAKIIKTDETTRKIDLSIKRYEKEKEREEIRKYTNVTEKKFTLRDMLNDKLNND
ncbi:MAG: 30S ribosomal protein S1 [Elusimicrobiota bacterium]